MTLKSSEEILKFIPSLFEVNLNAEHGESTLFTKLAAFLDFEEAFIFFLNPAGIQLKYSYKQHKNYPADTVFPLDGKLKTSLYSKEGLITDDKSPVINAVGLDSLKKKSYLISKISIKSTVFGIIMLLKKERDFYSPSDLQALDAAASVISYLLKDVELSNVFKIQLKALKDGMLEKNNAYKTIKEQNEKILESDKAKNEFLANISHELRTPLNSILGFSEILDANLYGTLNPKQQEFVRDIKVSATHLLGMINEILDMSKIEAKAMKLVKSNFMISVAIEEVLNIIKPLSDKKQIRIIKELRKDFEVTADYQKIQQILYNLLSNAIKFTPEGGQIEICASKNKSGFKLVVHDNGIGIDKKYHGKIFAKFVQLDSAYTKKESSTGLGLAITKELTELHGGKISLVSKINNGSSFIVEIPQD